MPLTIKTDAVAWKAEVQMPISPDHLAIYFNAGLAAAAYEYGVGIRRLSLRFSNRRRDRPQLMPLAPFVKSRPMSADPFQPYADYATTLLAGSAGRFIGLESFLGYARPHFDMLRLERAHLAEAAMCLERETDRAYSIIVARLEDLHGGDAEITFAELWRRANYLLRQSPHQARMAQVADELRRRRTLGGEALAELFAR